MQRPRNYSAARHIFEEGLAVLSAGGWPARVAYGLGLQGAIRSTEHIVATAAFPANTPPLRIAFAADFHAGPVTSERLLELACARLADVRADVLLLGGDFVSYRSRNVRALARMLGEIPAPLGRYAVLGNHDHWAGGQHVADTLAANGVQLLTNCNVRLPAPHESIWICGIDDHSSGEPDAERAFAGANGLRIALMHSPSGLLDIDEHNFHLSLSGHTHGGQIALPGGFPMYVPVGALSRQLVYGRYVWPRGANEAVVIVSRGIGCSALPVRLFADPEIVICTLSPL
jgi:uncharacterized protein